MTRDILLLTTLAMSVLLIEPAIAHGDQKPVGPQLQESLLTRVPVEITKVEYKELRDGKHNIVVNWNLSRTASGLRITRINIQVELTDARGVKRKATRTMDARPRSGQISITPIPIPRDPIVAIPISDMFRTPRGFEGGGGLGIDGLRFKVTLTATALTETGASRTITGIATKEGTIKVKR